MHCRKPRRHAARELPGIRVSLRFRALSRPSPAFSRSLLRFMRQVVSRVAGFPELLPRHLPESCFFLLFAHSISRPPEDQWRNRWHNRGSDPAACPPSHPQQNRVVVPGPLLHRAGRVFLLESPPITVGWGGPGGIPKAIPLVKFQGCFKAVFFPHGGTRDLSIKPTSVQAKVTKLKSLFGCRPCSKNARNHFFPQGLASFVETCNLREFCQREF